MADKLINHSSIQRDLEFILAEDTKKLSAEAT